MTEAEMCLLYGAGQTTQQIGAASGISHQRVNRILRLNGVVIRTRRFAKPRNRRKAPEDLITIEKRFDRAYVVVASGCWHWVRSRNSNGYGKIVVNNRLTYAHRYSHERFKGPIPDGLTIDHLCRNRACVNPDHLEAVTFQENVRRASNPLPLLSQHGR